LDPSDGELGGGDVALFGDFEDFVDEFDVDFESAGLE
jgi:hypothetical protein